MAARTMSATRTVATARAARTVFNQANTRLNTIGDPQTPLGFLWGTETILWDVDQLSWGT